MRMASDLDLVRIGHGGDILDEVRNALPRRVGIHVSRPRQRRLRLRLGELPRRVARSSAAWRALRAHNAQQRHVVLDRRNSRGLAILNRLVEVVDIPLPTGLLTEHHVAAFLAVKAEGRSLEDIATPLSAASPDAG